VLDDAWQPGGPELTPTFKLRRTAIAAASPTGPPRGDQHVADLSHLVVVGYAAVGPAELSVADQR
jgi:hypothetical protein